MAASDEVPEGAAVLPLIPVELGIHPMLLAILHAVVFLEGSEAKIVNPDAALEAMEYVATYLQRLGISDVRRLKEDLLVLEKYAAEQHWPREYAEFFKEFLSNLGIGEEA